MELTIEKIQECKKVKEFQDTFGLYGGEYGFHTISQIVEVEIKNILI
jgi:hypothetical protein